jgi:2-ketoarginine methyltransferase
MYENRLCEIIQQIHQLRKFFFQEYGMKHNIHKITEKRLSAGLQPIRNFVLAQALYHFMDIGIQESIKSSQPVSVSMLATQLNLHENRLRGLLQYLANEGYVVLENNIVHLTIKGKEISDFQPWYKLLIGGYAGTFQQISLVLKSEGPYANRDSANVGVGSCGISQYDALPMTRQLLEKIPIHVETVVDLGCGDGSYLVDLCKLIPNIRGIGLDLDQNSINIAKKAAFQNGIANRVNIEVGSAIELPDFSEETKPLCFITAFVLQEVLEQSGRSSIIDMLTSVFEKYPDSYWVVIEVDNRAEDKAIMAKDLGLAYYNPYYLIHHLTQQRLERLNFWEQLFLEAGLHIISISHPDPSYDSLKLKVGFLLERKT